MKRFLPAHFRARIAFTLVELMVAMTILAAILTCLLAAIGQASTIWRSASNKIEAFQDARAAFDMMTQRVSQATLNTYLDYDSPTEPTNYYRHSDLQLLCGPAGADGLPGTPSTGQALFFQAPAGRVLDGNKAALGGMEGLLNGCGYYVEFTSDRETMPGDTISLVKNLIENRAERYRFRLMQMVIPTENNHVYTPSSGAKWFEGHASDTQQIAENIIALIIRPQDPAAKSAEVPGATSPNLTVDYKYDSDALFTKPQPLTSHQLPPVIQVTMVAITEASAQRITSGSRVPAQIASALAGKFSNPASYDGDLSDLQTALNNIQPHIEYCIFSSAVPIRESRWTK